MIKMKNILAENLLRFGVKNLKESDKEKLSESLLTEAFQKNYWFDSITKDPTFSNEQFSFYKINVTGNCAAKFGFKVAPNALSEPYNQDLIFVQFSNRKLATIKSIADLDTYFRDPKNDTDGIEALNVANPSGAGKNLKGVAFLEKLKSYYTGTNAQGKPFAYGVNVTPNTIYQAMLVSLAGALNIA